MAAPFDFFVVLADMRTGSNALEEKLNSYEGIACHGEVFNPRFIGNADNRTLFGRSVAARDEDPLAMIGALRAATDGIAGFRLFSDHDPRVLDHCLQNRRCAKIVLTRNPVQSYVSLKIARSTGQWWLGDMKSAKSGKARFDAREFEDYAHARRSFLAHIRHRLQSTGQTGFTIDYTELGDEDVLDGLARYLGGGDRDERPATKGKVQNPRPMSEKVSNFAEMQSVLSSRDPFDLDALPEFEPTRGPNVPAFVLSPTAPLLYMPVKCSAEDRVRPWMAMVGGGSEDDLVVGRTQKQLRQWKRQQGRHMTFTVVSHPLARAHAAFCKFILPTEPPAFLGIRAALRDTYGIPLPDDPSDPSYHPAAHQAAFLGFLSFLKGNLNGQTSIRVDGAWASQSRLIQGMADFALPDAVLREDDLETELPHIARKFGLLAAGPASAPVARPHALSAIYDDTLEAACRAAYQKDYMMFGFGTWQAQASGCAA
ncbi:MAG: nodulation protein NodH [Pseudomonadota bacterium]